MKKLLFILLALPILFAATAFAIPYPPPDVGEVVKNTIEKDQVFAAEAIQIAFTAPEMDCYLVLANKETDLGRPVAINFQSWYAETGSVIGTVDANVRLRFRYSQYSNRIRADS
jgi:hypothetical protein